MVRREDKHTDTPYTGNREDINLEVIRDEPTSSRITVQCSYCNRRFEIGRSTLRNERALARKMHCTVQTPDTTLSTATVVNEPPVPDAPSVVVSSTGEGRRFLKDLCKVDEFILSVHRQPASDGTPMLYAKTVDQKLWLLGHELPQALGYPKVVYRTGSTVELEHALRLCKRQFEKERARVERRTQRLLEEDAEWRRRVQAFNLICNPKCCPRVEDCTSANLNMCLDMLIDEIPYHEDQPIFAENGACIGFRPRAGSHLPSHYIFMYSDSLHKHCIMDYHPPGSLDSPANLLPYLVDIVSKDSRSDGKECILQLHSGELIKVWMQIDDSRYMRTIFPQLDSLLEKPLLSIAFWTDDPVPPPVRVEPNVEQVPLLTQPAYLRLEHKDTTITHGLAQFGLTVEETRMPPSTHNDGGVERRLDMKREILEDKFEECLELISIVCPDHEMLTPEVYAGKHARLDVSKSGQPGLEALTTKLITCVDRLQLAAKPRTLPNFDKVSLDDLEAYQTCNALHRTIVLLHTRNGGQAPNLNRMNMERLEAYWAKVTQ